MTTQSPKPADRTLTGALTWLGDWRAVWVLTFAFIAVGLEAVIRGRYIHDEGLLTWQFAELLGNAPIAGLFFQKLRPMLALIYAPIAPLGFTAFSVVHLVVGASAIPLAAAISRQLGQRLFVIPALVIAGSPLMLMTAVAGHSNSDVTVGLLLATYLMLVKQRSFVGGVILGATVLVRSEVAPLLLAIAGERLLAKDTRVLVGIAVVPVAYTLLGMLYHRDLLWVVHYPPTLMTPTPDTTWFEPGSLIGKLEDTALALLCLSPAVGLLLLLRPRSLVAGERGLALGLVLFLLMIRGFPMVGLFNFDGAPRYLMAGLPALALLIGRQSDDACEGRDGGVLALVGLLLVAGFGVFTAEHGASALLLLAVAIWAASMALARLRRPTSALALWIGAALISWPLWPQHSWLLPSRAAFDDLGQWWKTRGPGPDDEVPVLTNIKTVSAWLDNRGLLDRSQPIHVLLQHDTVFELDTLLDHRVGQHQTVLRALDEHVYGRSIIAERDPLDWPAGTIVIFEDDDRLQRTVDLERWRQRLAIEVDDPEGRLLIGRVIRLEGDEEGRP